MKAPFPTWATNRGERKWDRYKLMAAFLVAFLVVGCDSGPKSPRGFRLPAGDVDKGLAAFVSLQCYACHTVDGVQLPAPTVVDKTPVPLGGEVSQIKTYGELVTSIINPSHKLSPKMREEWGRAAKMSPMPDYNQMLTVAQLIDLVSFLQSRYTRLEFTYPDYP